VTTSPKRGGRIRFEGLGARLAQRILPRTPDFAVLLHEQTELVASALHELVAYCESPGAEAAERVSQLEKQGDRLRERNVRELSRAFSTTFDRGQIAVAIHRIDDVANYAKTTVRELEALSLDPDEAMREMARELDAGGRALSDAALSLGSDPSGVAAGARAVHKSERNVEKRYRAVLATKFPVDAGSLPATGDPRVLVASHNDALRRREVYRHLSNAADRLDDAGRALLEMALTTM
jgi:uncharacterized protein Yka (UPF0111/DUF47 family)